MIVSETSTPEIAEFDLFMNKTNMRLNQAVQDSGKLYSDFAGVKLEPYVEEVMNEVAKGSPFEGTIKRWGAHKFPDIIANRFYGVEVKTTTGSHWTSTGNSILESTRLEDVEHIYMLFGKLAEPVEFRTRPYQDCLSDIVVTHYPRYLINMELPEGETIFDKMGIPYDSLRKLEEPVIPVAEYYRSQLKEGQSLWWLGTSKEDIEMVSPISLRMWNTLRSVERSLFLSEGMVLFPETILSSSPLKYNRFIQWLLLTKGVLLPNVRDEFSAGGRCDIITDYGVFPRAKKVLTRVKRNRIQIRNFIYQTDPKILLGSWNMLQLDKKNLLETWIKAVVDHASNGTLDGNILNAIFDYPSHGRQKS